MDFIIGLPQTKKMGSILVVVDRFSKYATFIPAPHGCKATEAANLFFKNIVKLWGLPIDIVSDRDSRFTGRFWTTLWKLMGTQLNFSTSYHPQTDGQTERVNQILEEYLRHYIAANQQNWVDLLDAAQFSYNLHRSASTGKSPFEMVLGQQPMTPNEIARERGGGRCPAAYRVAHEREQLMLEAQDCLAKAVQRMKKYADEGRRFLEFQVGDKVMLKLTPQVWKRITKRQVHKGLIQRYDGPFEVLRRVGKLAYLLELPERYQVHPVFHVSFLKPFYEDPVEPERSVLRRPHPTVRTQFDKEAEAILDKKVEGRNIRNWKIYYKVQWKGQETQEATWHKNTTLWQFEELIQQFESMRASTSSAGGGM